MRTIQIVAAGALALGIASAASGQVNAPVAPEAIYVARDGAAPGLSVLDLNGFGASTGNPAFTGTPVEGNSNFPNNPNVLFQGTLLRPPLLPGTSALDGGSAGVFTLTLDAQLDDLLLEAPDVAALGDLMLGHPLDSTFNNGLDANGCQGGGGNLCAIGGLKLVDVAAQSATSLKPTAPGDLSLNMVQGGGNPISFAPHPNPPPLLSVPLCQSPLIGGAEPTSVDHLKGANGALALANLLVPGDPFGSPAQGIPPSGLFALEQNAFFQGPSAPGVPLAACETYQVRQQVGHYLYATDRARDEIVVLNSNRMTVLDRITVLDPTELAMSPNLSLLGVTSRSGGHVAFIDVRPTSATFHQVVKVTPVGAGPVGIAWQPDDEDILVANELDDSVSILSAIDLNVRKVVTRGLRRPFAVAVTQRQAGFGSSRDVYYGWILSRDGRVSLYESGPFGVNGWGYNEIVAQTPFAFDRPAAIQPDPTRLSGGVWVAHANPVDTSGAPTGIVGGAVTNLALDVTVFGVLPLVPGEPPRLRGANLDVVRSIGPDQLTGTPTDLAFDDLRNLGALPGVQSLFGAGVPAPLNGKHLVRRIGTQIVPATTPTVLLLPVRGGAAGAGAVDVLDLATGTRVDTNPFQAGVQSIPAPGARVAAGYFRQ